MTLITPLRCKQIWTNFKQKTEDCYSIAEKYEEVLYYIQNYILWIKHFVCVVG